MKKYYISLSKYEEINIAGGLKNVWELNYLAFYSNVSIMDLRQIILLLL